MLLLIQWKFPGDIIRRTVMSKKNKVADSIIIRVGGGIREIPRQPAEVAERLESLHPESGFEQNEDVHQLGTEPGSNTKIGSGKIIN